LGRRQNQEESREGGEAPVEVEHALNHLDHAVMAEASETK